MLYLTEFEFWHHQLGHSVALVTFVNVRILGPQNFYADASASIMTIGLPNTNLHNFKAKYVQQILEKNIKQQNNTDKTHRQ